MEFGWVKHRPSENCCKIDFQFYPNRKKGIQPIKNTTHYPFYPAFFELTEVANLFQNYSGIYMELRRIIQEFLKISGFSTDKPTDKQNDL